MPMRSPRIMHLALAAASLLALFPGAMADNTAHLLVHKVRYPNVQQRAPIAILCAWLTLHRCWPPRRHLRKISSCKE